MLCKESVLVVRWFVLLRLGRGFVVGLARSCIAYLFDCCIHDMQGRDWTDCCLHRDQPQLDDRRYQQFSFDTSDRVVAL